MSKKIFLGGTCNNSDWREKLIPLLDIDYYNPVVDDWTEECYQEELRQREICDYCLYVITPRMKGVYSVAEVVDDSNKRPEKTVFCYLLDDNGAYFNPEKLKSMDAVCRMVNRNGGAVCMTLGEVARYVNGQKDN